MQRPGNDHRKGATEANSATHRVPLGGSPSFTQSVLLMIESFADCPNRSRTSDRAANVVTASEAREPEGVGESVSRNSSGDSSIGAVLVRTTACIPDSVGRPGCPQGEVCLLDAPREAA